MSRQIVAGDMVVLPSKLLSASSNVATLDIASSIGTLVNKLLTLKLTSRSQLFSVVFSIFTAKCSEFLT